MVAAFVGIITYIKTKAPWVFPVLFIAVASFVLTHVTNSILDCFAVKNIKKAKLVDVTQRSKEKIEPSGFSLGRGGSRTYWRIKQVPGEKKVVFEVVFTDGKVSRITTKEGSKRYESIIPYIGNTSQNTKNKKRNEEEDIEKYNEPYAAEFELKKNQITVGTYVIGKEIPAGRYDLIWVWGSGNIRKHKNKKDPIISTNYYVHIGDGYKCKMCVGVPCLEEECLQIEGNLVVEIKKSKEIEIEL